MAIVTFIEQDRDYHITLVTKQFVAELRSTYHTDVRIHAALLTKPISGWVARTHPFSHGFGGFFKEVELIGDDNASSRAREKPLISSVC